MSSPYDDLKFKEGEARKREGVFEVVPLAERRRFPFINIDPEMPNQVLEYPDKFKMMFRDACRDLGMEAEYNDFMDLSLRVILHFTLEPPFREEFFRYKDVFEGDLNYFFSEKVQKLIEGLKVVDYGAAEGAMVKVLRSFGVEAEGIDLTDQRDGVVFGRERLQQLEPDSLDIVISTRLLRSLKGEAHQEAVDIFMRALKPGGLLITIPPIEGDLSSLSKLDPKFGQFDCPPNRENQDNTWGYTIARKAVI